MKIYKVGTFEVISMQDVFPACDYKGRSHASFQVIRGQGHTYAYVPGCPGRPVEIRHARKAVEMAVNMERENHIKCGSRSFWN